MKHSHPEAPKEGEINSYIGRHTKDTFIMFFRFVVL